MAEYIEREALRKILIEHFDADFDSDGKLMYSDHICTGEDCDDLLKLVNKIPTADVVEVRHGEWLNGVTGYTCSVCNKQEPTKRFLYCPNCGAKMDGKEVANNG